METVRVYGVNEAQLSVLENAIQETLDLQRLMAGTILIYVRAPTFARRAELRAAAEKALPLLQDRENTLHNFMVELRAQPVPDRVER